MSADVQLLTCHAETMGAALKAVQDGAPAHQVGLAALASAWKIAEICGLTHVEIDTLTMNHMARERMKETAR